MESAMEPYMMPPFQVLGEANPSSSDVPLASVEVEPIPILVIAISGSPSSGKTTLAIGVLMIIVNSLRDTRARVFERTLLFQDAHMAHSDTPSYHPNPMTSFVPRRPIDNDVVHNLQNQLHVASIDTPDLDRLEGLDLPFLHWNLTHELSQMYRILKWKKGARERVQEARRIHNFLNLTPGEIFNDPSMIEQSLNRKAKDYFEKAMFMAIIEGCRTQGPRSRD